ncbi:hypothetical protein EV714DRAFT_240455, partial [Schizophyllum commune]
VLELEHGKVAAERIIADIDRHIAVVPHFPGLRQFLQGRGFKQWMGDDSKALMKVILPAIKGYVLPQMLRAVSAFLEFCYLVRSNGVDEDTIICIQVLRGEARTQTTDHKMTVKDKVSIPFRTVQAHQLQHQDALERFHHDRVIFERKGSAHIRAVKRPWLRSNQYSTLWQMLIINERIDKLAACCTDFESHSMLPHAHPTSFNLPLPSNTGNDEDDEGASEKQTILGEVILAKTCTREPQSDIPSSKIPSSNYPQFDGNLHVVASAIATYYTPSDQCGAGGMHRERIRSIHSW